MNLKVLDAIGSDPAQAQNRGAFVAFGNTHPAARKLVYGLQQRGLPGDGAWNWAQGTGYVPAHGGDYQRAQKMGVTPHLCLIETFGGVAPDLDKLLTELAAERQNRLAKWEYDQATWATRTWKTFAIQRLSVAAHISIAFESAHALGLSVALDPRGAPVM